MFKDFVGKDCEFVVSFAGFVSGMNKSTLTPMTFVGTLLKDEDNFLKVLVKRLQAKAMGLDFEFKKEINKVALINKQYLISAIMLG